MAITEQTEETTTTATTQTVINATSPLYIHSSDSPGSTLVPAPFDEIGYRSWRRSVLRALSVKNKLGFINGDSKRPDVTSLHFRQWERCDDMVTSWILNSLSKDIADSVEYVNDFVELWKELEDRYDQKNGAKLCLCTCGAKESMHKAEQDRRLIQFLMGLNKVYTIFRGSILMMNPLSSMAQTFALLIQEKKQREFRPRNQLNVDSTTLNVNLGGRTFKTNYSTGTGNQIANSRPRPFYDYCKRQGHTEDKCYKLHGYP
nr:uncharacterized protein LOC104089199 [Nicotiana tomentosiformis]